MADETKPDAQAPSSTIVLDNGDRKTYPFLFPQAWWPSLERARRVPVINIMKGADWPGNEKEPPVKGGFAVQFADGHCEAVPYTAEPLAALQDFIHHRVIRDFIMIEVAAPLAPGDAPEADAAHGPPAIPPGLAVEIIVDPRDVAQTMRRQPGHSGDAPEPVIDPSLPEDAALNDVAPEAEMPKEPEPDPDFQ